MEIKFLPAGCGDAVLISFEDTSSTRRLIVVDFGGEKYSGNDELISILRREVIDAQGIDLFIITHMDDDHVGGVVSLFKRGYSDITDGVKEWWLNHSLEILSHSNSSSGRKISARQVVDLKEFLNKEGKCPKEPILLGEERNIGGLKIAVISPDIDSYNKAKDITLKEENRRRTKIGAKLYDHELSFNDLKLKNFEKDTSPTNRSSIAFIVDYSGTRGLFLADAHADLIEDALKGMKYSSENKLSLDFVKVSHHGSRKNTSPELLELLDCPNYIISVNGTNAHALPDKEALFRIIKIGTKENPVTLYFTHEDRKLRSIFTQEERENPNYHFDLKFPKGILTYPFET